MIALNPDVAHCGAATLVVACQQAGVALCMPLGISDAYALTTRLPTRLRTSRESAQPSRQTAGPLEKANVHAAKV